MEMEINKFTRPLQLPYIGNNFDLLVEEATNTKMGYAQFMIDAFSKELEQRQESRVQRRIKEARFPYRKYLADLDLNEFNDEINNDIENLMTLDFISAKENVILIGNSGRAKTHIAVGLGISACLADKRVLFTNVPNLVIELKEALSRSAVTAFRNKFVKFELVIIDELCEALHNSSHVKRF